MCSLAAIVFQRYHPVHRWAQSGDGCPKRWIHHLHFAMYGEEIQCNKQGRGHTQSPP